MVFSKTETKRRPPFVKTYVENKNYVKDNPSIFSLFNQVNGWQKLTFPFFFTIHYFLKKLGIKFVKFPEMAMNFYNCKFMTRKDTIDFWSVSYVHQKVFYDYIFLKDYFSRLEDGILIDVGAHIGAFSIAFAKKGWDVYSFEPLKDSFNQLIKNTRINEVDKNIKFYNLALGNKKSFKKIFYDRYKTGEASFVEKKFGNSEIVKIDRLDSIIRKKFDKPVILKIDAEGFEYEVLKGALRFIKENKPLINIEIWDYNKNKTENLLKKIGYNRDNFLWVYKNKVLHLHMKNLPTFLV